MKISKERLLEIIQEEVGMAIMPQISYEMTPDGEIDREGRMAKRQLSDISKYAHDLDQMLQDETQLEAWVQAKLTKAADYLKTVKHYVEYGMEEGAYDQIEPIDPVGSGEIDFDDQVVVDMLEKLVKE